MIDYTDQIKKPTLKCMLVDYWVSNSFEFIELPSD